MKNLLTALAIFIVLFSQAQNVDFKKKNFKSEADYETASDALDKGDEQFFSGNFDKALPRFLEAQELNPNNALLNFKIGACYLKNDELKKSTPYFEKAKELDPKVDPKIDFALAQSYQANKQYDNAVESYQLYLASLSKSKKAAEEPKVQKNIDICSAELQKIQTKLEEEKEQVEAAKEPEPVIVEEKEAPVEEVAVVAAPVEEKKEEPKQVEPEPTKVVAVSTPVANVKTEKITYRIQIASTSSPASSMALKKIYSGSLKISNEKIAGRHKYFIGDFSSKEEALKAKSKSGISDAFIVKFKNGKKI